MLTDHALNARYTFEHTSVQNVVKHILRRAIIEGWNAGHEFKQAHA
jgi:putative flippase GtrA